MSPFQVNLKIEASTNCYRGIKMAEKKGKFEFDDKLKAGVHKAGEELKEHGGELKKDISEAGSKLKKKIK